MRNVGERLVRPGPALCRAAGPALERIRDTHISRRWPPYIASLSYLSELRYVPRSTSRLHPTTCVKHRNPTDL
jgi:hypothetical protein